jgi:hypothetical protein
MPQADPKEADKTKRKEPGAVIFRCQRCGKGKPIEEMRVVTRFFPLMVVCRECEREIH